MNGDNRTPDRPPWNTRAKPDPHDAARGGFVVDRDRIVHCDTFRELQHKTQVQSLLYAPKDSVFRTRLNHVIEVAQLARSLARALAADETLAEAIALAHDLGHPPFGHAGERALRAALEAHSAGEWNANVHSLAVVDEIECSFIDFRGLNLTWATREGIARHSTPFDAPISFGEFSETPHGGIECQIVDAADVLAYLSHDLDDALAGGYVQLDELGDVSPHLQELVQAAENAHRAHRHVWPNGDAETVVRRAVVARLISTSLADIIGASLEQLALLGDDRPKLVRARPERTVVHSPPHAEVTSTLLALLAERYYRSDAVATADTDAGWLIRELFEFLLAQPELVPERFRVDSDAVAVATYIASLNDRTATLLAEELGIAQAPSAS